MHAQIHMQSLEKKIRKVLKERPSLDKVDAQYASDTYSRLFLGLEHVLLPLYKGKSASQKVQSIPALHFILI